MAKTLKVRVQGDGYGGEKKVGLYETHASDQVAQLASVFLEKWGLVAGIPDGEDSAGRQRLRLPTASEVVTRAYEIAEEHFRQAEARGHFIELPDLNAINADWDAEREEEAQAKKRRRQAAREAEHS